MTLGLFFQERWIIGPGEKTGERRRWARKQERSFCPSVISWLWWWWTWSSHSLPHFRAELTDCSSILSVGAFMIILLFNTCSSQENYRLRGPKTIPIIIWNPDQSCKIQLITRCISSLQLNYPSLQHMIYWFMKSSSLSLSHLGLWIPNE